MPLSYEEFDLSDVRTYPLASRQSKARIEDFARPVGAGPRSRNGSIRCPPSSARRTSAGSWTRSSQHAGGPRIIWGIGAHVIKTGVSPVLIDLMRRGYVSALAMNGAGIIHDFEVALSGATSEDVDEALGPGRFGMAEETGRLLNEDQSGRGRPPAGLRSGGRRHPRRAEPPHAERSLAVGGAPARHPVTVHVASAPTSSTCIPAASGAAIGDVSLRDFRYFTSCVARLTGGVYLNCGSAVVLPEVFLKAVALARNQGSRSTA